MVRTRMAQTRSGKTRPDFKFKSYGQPPPPQMNSKIPMQSPHHMTTKQLDGFSL